MRIPFDRHCLAAALAELAPFTGARVQKVVADGPSGVGIELYAGKTGWLLAHWDASFPRLVLADRPPPSDPHGFALLLRARLAGARLQGVRAVEGDRVALLDFVRPEGILRLVVELLGTRANAFLLDAESRVLGMGRRMRTDGRVGLARPYALPPPAEGDSPVARALKGRVGPPWGAWVSDAGVYPVSLAELGVDDRPASAFGRAVDAYARQRTGASESEARRRQLAAQLDRVIRAREKSLAGLESALEAGARADTLQRHGELILAYQAQISPGASMLEARDFEGEPTTVALDPKVSPLENAKRLFDRARRAKQAEPSAAEQRARLSHDLEAVRALRANLEHYASTEELLKAEAFARHHRWLHNLALPQAKEDRPFGGHRVREVLGPGGYEVLYGENAEANDFLTLRVAKPSDWWLHVRGGPSSHVVIRTGGAPDRVPRETLVFAARLAVRHSPSKHSSYVPVDYTLRRYVRRSRGASAGTVEYTHEKTLHVEP